MSEELRLLLLGPPRFERNGSFIEITRRKAVALLAYLAETGQSHSRDALATLLWPNSDQSRARAALRRVLSDLNKELGETWLDTTGETVSFSTGVRLWVDTQAFHDHLARSQAYGEAIEDEEVFAAAGPLLTGAINLYRDDFMAGFTLPDSPEFDDWQFFHTESLRRELAGALERLVHYYSAQAAFEAAIPSARRWLALDPLLEAPHRTLMQLYAWTGQRTAALRQYQTCVQILDEELNVAPAEETTALYERIRRGELSQHSNRKTGLEREEQTRDHLRLDPAESPPSAEVDETGPLAVPPAGVADEIRLVTVLFAGLGAAESDIWNLDPEETATETDTLLQIVTAVVTKYGAQVDRFVADQVQVVFGVPQLHEDDPERALRAALDIQKLAQENGVTVAIGISTGQVYFGHIGAAARQGVTAVGPVVNLAARLRDQAGAGQILVSAATYRYTQRMFAFTPFAVELRDKSKAIMAYEAGEVLPHPEKARGIEGLQAALIGRDEELDRLNFALEAVLQGQGQVISLIGEAGLGKSRLVAELRQKAEIARRHETPNSWLEGRCLELGKGISYWPFIDILRVYIYFCVERRTGLADSLVRVLQQMVHRGSLSAARVEEIGPLLGNLLSLQFGNEWDERLKNASPEQIRHQTFTAIHDFFVALARQEPLILVFEDLHWADEHSLDLISLLMDSVTSNPLLLLCVYRPEQQHKVQRLAAIATQKGGEQYTEIWLRELTPRQSRRLVGALLAAEQLPGRVEDLIAERSRGNPFFLEEAIRALIDAQKLYRENGDWKVRGELDAVTVPEGVQSIILSRVDRLPAHLKHVLRLAAVIGRLFQVKVLAALTPPAVDLTAALQSLEEAALIYRERTVPEIEYSFKHVLTQETVYQLLSRQQRRELHRQVATALERLYQDNPGEYVEQIAHHFDRSDADEKAIEYLLKAGQKSWRAYLNDEAIHYLQQALVRLEERLADASDPIDPAWLRWQLDALFTLGEIYYNLGRSADAERYLQQAIAVGQKIEVESSVLIRLYHSLGEVFHWEGRHTEQIRLGQAGIALLAKEDVESIESVLMNQIMAVGYLEQANQEQFHHLTQRTAQFIKRLPYSEELRPSYIHIFVSLYLKKRVTEAMQWLRHLEKLAQAHHDLRALAEVYEHRWSSNFDRGDLRNITEHVPRVIELYSKIGDNIRLRRYLTSMMWVTLMSGDLAEAEKYAAQENELIESRSLLELDSTFYLIRGLIFLARRAWEQAAEAFRQAAQSRSGKRPGSFKSAAIYCLGRAYLAQGHRQEAIGQFQAALDLFNPQARTSWRFKWWPIFAAVLNGLESACDDPAQFRAFVQSFKQTRSGLTSPSVPEQWFLEEMKTPALESPPPDASMIYEIFGDDLQPDWVWHDPLADCAYRLEVGLEIQAVNGRDLWYVNHNAPRLLRPVSGDFVVQTICRPAAAANSDQSEPKVTPLPAIGGLLLWQDAENYLRLVWGSRGPRELSFEGCLANQDMIIGRGLLPPGEQAFIRLARHGDQISALGSADGDTWFRVGQTTLRLADPLQVGLHAVGWIDRTIYHGAYPNGTAVRFDNFHLWA